VIADMLFTLIAGADAAGHRLSMLTQLSSTEFTERWIQVVDRALCRRRAVLGARDLHADRDARSRAVKPRRKTGRCRCGYFALFSRGFLFGIPGFGSVMAILWLMIAKPF